jgi:hypothetical protein
MSRADLYEKLNTRLGELVGTAQGLAKQISDGTALNLKAGVPSKEYLDRLKEALASHVKHAQEVLDGIEEIERQAGARPTET